MLSPFMTVVILVVLWLIVVVPMVLRRSDELRRERSVSNFGRAMRALGRRAPTTSGAEVYVPMARSQASPAHPSKPALAAPDRRPVPAAQEALMYPPDRSELSAARTQMLTRRRRSLGILAGGSALFGMLALIMGGTMWLLATPCMVGFVGYLWFLRNQALRDRARRENRQSRAAARRPAGYDATEEVSRFDEAPDSIVRIDDDDLELMSMDTIDLTGLYSEELTPAATERRAS